MVGPGPIGRIDPAIRQCGVLVPEIHRAYPSRRSVPHHCALGANHGDGPWYSPWRTWRGVDDDESDAPRPQGGGPAVNRVREGFISVAAYPAARRLGGKPTNCARTQRASQSCWKINRRDVGTCNRSRPDGFSKREMSGRGSQPTLAQRKSLQNCSKTIRFRKKRSAVLIERLIKHKVFRAWSAAPWTDQIMGDPYA